MSANGKRAAKLAKVKPAVQHQQAAKPAARQSRHQSRHLSLPAKAHGRSINMAVSLVVIGHAINAMVGQPQQRRGHRS